MRLLEKKKKREGISQAERREDDVLGKTFWRDQTLNVSEARTKGSEGEAGGTEVEETVSGTV